MKTLQEINEKIKKGQAVVVTKEELLDLIEKKGIERVAKEVDVVTTATFGPMCSSGAYFNFGHTKPKIKAGGGKATLTTVQGEPLTAWMKGKILYLTDAKGGKSAVTIKDVMQSNGVIHVINTVMLP